MCLVLLAHRVHPRYPLILLGNRDERFGREAAAAGWWEDHPEVLGGRDLRRMGTWLGISRSGRVAAVTYYREPPTGEAFDTSRGHLASGFLTGEASLEGYAEALRREGARYDGYNLIYGALAGPKPGLSYATNRGPGVARLEPGLYGLSNGPLDAPWPKVERGKRLLGRLIEGRLATEELAPEALLEILHDTHAPPDAALPETGFGLPLERLLAPIFIAADRRGEETYGTRASSALLVDAEGRALLLEESHLDGRLTRHEFRLEPA